MYFKESRQLPPPTRMTSFYVFLSLAIVTSTAEIHIKLIKNPGVFYRSLSDSEIIFAESFVQIYFSYPIREDLRPEDIRKGDTLFQHHHKMTKFLDKMIGDLKESLDVLQGKNTSTPPPPNEIGQAKRSLYSRLKDNDGKFYESIEDEMVREYFQKLFGICSSGVLGKLDMEIIPPLELQEGINSFQSEADKRGVETSIGFDRITDYYHMKIAQCEFKDEDESLLMTVKIPIRRKELDFDFKRRVEVGFRNAGQFCKVSSTDSILTIGGEKRYMSPNNGEYLGTDQNRHYCNLNYDFGHLCVVPKNFEGSEDKCSEAIHILDDIREIKAHCTRGWYCTPFSQPIVEVVGGSLYLTNAVEEIEIKCSKNPHKDQVLVSEDEKKEWTGTLEIRNFPFKAECDLLHGGKVIYTTRNPIHKQLHINGDDIVEEEVEVVKKDKFRGIPEELLDPEDDVIVFQRIPALWAGVEEESEGLQIESVIYRNNSGRIEVVGTLDGLKPMSQAHSEDYDFNFWWICLTSLILSYLVVKRIWR